MLIGLLFCGAVAATIAEAKGRSKWEFFAAGVFLGPVGILWAALLSRSPEAEAERQLAVEAARQRLEDQRRPDQR